MDLKNILKNKDILKNIIKNNNTIKNKNKYSILFISTFMSISLNFLFILIPSFLSKQQEISNTFQVDFELLDNIIYQYLHLFYTALLFFSLYSLFNIALNFSFLALKKYLLLKNKDTLFKFSFNFLYNRNNLIYTNKSITLRVNEFIKKLSKEEENFIINNSDIFKKQKNINNLINEILKSKIYKEDEDFYILLLQFFKNKIDTEDIKSLKNIKTINNKIKNKDKILIKCL